MKKFVLLFCLLKNAKCYHVKICLNSNIDKICARWSDQLHQHLCWRVRCPVSRLTPSLTPDLTSLLHNPSYTPVSFSFSSHWFCDLFNILDFHYFENWKFVFEFWLIFFNFQKNAFNADLARKKRIGWINMNYLVRIISLILVLHPTGGETNDERCSCK